MLTEKQILEIKEHLENSQNPVFFFDNDPDGLCSFLLLQRWLGRGKGVSVKSFPDLNESYFRKVSELNADYIFILDKPVVSDGFFKKVEQVNLPVVWLDHHEIEPGFLENLPSFVNYFNPLLNKQKSNEPTTALCYELTKKKEDIWLAVIGCIADNFMPDFYKNFQEEYSDLSIKTNKPFDVLYKSELGKITKIMSNGLKDKTTNVVAMLKFLTNVKTPYDVLEENSKNKLMHKRYGEIEKKYQNLLEKAKSHARENEKILFFKYSGDLSISGELANELSYVYPEKIIAVAYVKGLKVNLSLRGKTIKDSFLKIIKNFEGAGGGGHRDAVGGNISASNLDEFRKKLGEIFEKD